MSPRVSTVTGSAVAVIPVRDGTLPLGADEAVAEAGGRAVLVGSGTAAAASDLRTAVAIWAADIGAFAPAAWAARLAPTLEGVPMVVLPASPDGRDLAPRIAHAMGRSFYAGAVSIGADRVVLARQGGLVEEVHAVNGPAVATMEPGVRGVDPPTPPPDAVPLALADRPSGPADVDVLAVLPPDPATMDLSEAKRIVAGGAGLGGPGPFDALRRVAARVGASWGGSRVAADAGWIPQDRFIGTTGVTTTAQLYIALGISGAVQHVTGLGDPDHIVAVNLDASAPMMAMADLAIVTDARALIDELDRLLPAQPAADA